VCGEVGVCVCVSITFSWNTKQLRRAVACSAVRSLKSPLNTISVRRNSSALKNTHRDKQHPQPHTHPQQHTHTPTHTMRVLLKDQVSLHRVGNIQPGQTQPSKTRLPASP